MLFVVIRITSRRMLLKLRESLHNIDTSVTIEYAEMQYKVLFNYLGLGPSFPNENSAPKGIPRRWAGAGGVRSRIRLWRWPVYRRNLISLNLEVALNRDPRPWGGELYQKILVPLDRSTGAEGATSMAQQLLSPDGEGILLHVLRRRKTAESAESERTMSPTAPRQDARRAKAMGYLRCAQDYLLKPSGRWRCEVVEADSVADGIAEFAMKEGVDLIAMYTNDRKGLAGVIRKSIAAQVQQQGAVEVRVLRPREMAAR